MYEKFHEKNSILLQINVRVINLRLPIRILHMKLIIVEIYKQHKEPLTRASTREISLIFMSIKEKLHGAFTDEFKKSL